MSETPGFNAFLIRSSVVAALGGLLFGFDTAVIAGTTSALSTTFHLTPGLLGITVSSALWGTVLGSMVAGAPSDKYGRRVALRILAILYLLSAIGCAFSWDWYSLLIARFLGGLAIGGSSVIGPMYIAEIAPASRRGRLVGLFQFNIVCGILVAYFSNYVIGLAVTGDNAWRWKLGIAALPAAFFFGALFGIPQSPRWLVRRNLNDEAREVFRRIGDPDPDGEVRDIVESIALEERVQGEALFTRKYQFPILLAISLAMFNQLSGVNAILYYANDIFEQAGFGKNTSGLQAMAIGFTNLIFTILAMSVIDRIGRKKLLLIGAVGTCACLAGAALIFATGRNQGMLLWLLVGFIGFFAFSQGAVIWVYLSEIFPNLVRAKGQSLGSFTHWIMNAIISGVFPMVAAISRPAPFAFFASLMIVEFFVILMFFPETKGVTLEAMESNLAARASGSK